MRNPGNIFLFLLMVSYYVIHIYLSSFFLSLFGLWSCWGCCIHADRLQDGVHNAGLVLKHGAG